MAQERKSSNTPSSFLSPLFLQNKQPVLTVPPVLPIAFPCFLLAFSHCNGVFMSYDLALITVSLVIYDYIKKFMITEKKYLLLRSLDMKRVDLDSSGVLRVVWGPDPL